MVSSTVDEFAIQISDLTVRRGKRLAVDHLSATIARGSITGVLGPSGCGKTTLMRAIVGTQQLTAGSVLINDIAAGSASLRGRLGYVTQSPSIYSDLTVGQNVDYFAAVSAARTSPTARRAAVAQALSAVGLDSYVTSVATNLSGGQRGRVSIACALVTDPDILVLDEPTVGLDPVLRADLWKRFRRLADDGRTLVVSSHVMDEADHCDDLLLMREGALVAHLSPDELRAQTGQRNLESAFLALITATDSGE